ncbi:hypothetical protein [Campylobacter sp. RM16192]|uniref:hypothetical protein n=1 Tax=Campylobacter sp. RM16192 TaxID=1660080 RepID=UPI0014517D72|nr:hypothetical protein [Campylobacter sp. RM16192]QCD51950.1 putative protein, pyridoxine 5'-phosphate oxidase family [Campylobacter sp. RM16192]
MDERILNFISKMHLLSLAVISEAKPYAASCFYAFDSENFSLIVAGDDKTTHIKALEISSEVAGTIALDTKIVGKIEGVQFRGVMSKASEDERKIYFKRFPYALAMRPQIYAISLQWIKFTHNALGFGKKIEWSRNF